VYFQSIIFLEMYYLSSSLVQNGQFISFSMFCTCFQAIQEQMRMHSQEPVSFDDIKNEIFDMVKPKDPLRITFQDLVRWFV